MSGYVESTAGSSHLTSDPADPRLTHGMDDVPVAMADAYLVLPDEERAKGFVRPLRTGYRHVGIAGPSHPLRDITPEEQDRFGAGHYAKFEPYPEGSGAIGRFWTQAQLDSVGKGCGVVTTMSLPLAETYARQPAFYGGTYCASCRMHRPVGRDGEFVWEPMVGETIPPEFQRVGT